ncbi:MAG: molybdenum cofactor biosynthesis protein MoaE [Candidatus Odinarchaeum yellowstonii]|uniref:Molybdenum cofactor biosynthesis protein MoaE n=1 Tax=Odinarchaeota yellowstonii (strain LCB_4) TaxID=1841599 RepID=A0AAF0D181_ODILC|nr:MAG: molybdenum cofactor biosynthesis protein MoaE [Candidatus Odinarchaeum yellowstonii]
MYEGRVVGKGELSFESVLKNVKERGLANTGAIASFIGVVRPTSKTGKPVRKIYVESWREAANISLNRIARELSERPGISSVLIYHFEGELKVGEDIVYVVVAGDHRGNVFPVLTEAVERYKRESEIWKKEFFEDGESIWVEEI